MTTTAHSRRAFHFVAAAILGLAAFSLPAGATAQDGWSVQRAESMEAEAQSLSDQRHKWEKAAWLYRSAASLRPQGDLVAVEDLQWAGKLAWYTGDASQALTDLEQAAERAMEGGDVFTAANLLVDAAWVATRSGKHERATELSRQAQVHAASPILSDEVRRRVTDRVIDLAAITQVATSDAGGSDR
jgi:hypothetical protein